MSLSIVPSGMSRVEKTNFLRAAKEGQNSHDPDFTSAALLVSSI